MTLNPRYQINLSLRKDELDRINIAKKKVNYSNKQMMLLAASYILDEEAELQKKLIDFDQ